LYQFHTGLGWHRPVANTDDLLEYSVSGNPRASDDPNFAGGMPVVWESWWDTGVIALGSARPFEAAFGVVRGTPGWANAGEEENSGKCYLGRLGIMPHPAIRAGISGAIGPYLEEEANDLLPPGKTAEDYDQRLAMVDAEFCSGTSKCGEAYRNVWQTPSSGTCG
jgi:hypothetical protein